MGRAGRLSVHTLDERARGMRETVPSFLHASRLSATESVPLNDFVVTFLTRTGCHLCEQALPIVAGAVGRLGGELVEIDVDSDVDLAQRFGTRIPVILGPGGSLVAEGSIDDERAVYRTLKRLKRG